MINAIIVALVLAAIIVPVVMAELRRVRPRRAKPAPVAPRRAKRAAGAPPLRLVVRKEEMDAELGALLARERRDTEST